MESTRIRLLAIVAVLMIAATSVAQQREERSNQPRQNRAERRMRGPTHAVAVLVAIGESKVAGTVHFLREGEQVRVKGRVEGLEPGKHGFHVHQYGDLSDLETGKSAGDHFNPGEAPHGRPTDAERHAGDLGNIEADENGVAEFDMTDSHLRLGGPGSIIGRALVIHAGEDKFTQPSGDAGDRVAVGVIGIAAPQQN